MDSSPTKSIAKLIEKRKLELTKAKLTHLTSNEVLKKRVCELQEELKNIETQRALKAAQLEQTEHKAKELGRANERLKILKPFALMLTSDQSSDLGDPTLRLLKLLLGHLKTVKQLLYNETAATEALDISVAKQTQYRKELEAELRTIRPYDTLIHNFLRVLIAPKLKGNSESSSPDSKLSFAEKLRLRPS